MLGGVGVATGVTISTPAAATLPGSDTVGRLAQPSAVAAEGNAAAAVAVGGAAGAIVTALSWGALAAIATAPGRLDGRRGRRRCRGRDRHRAVLGRSPGHRDRPLDVPMAAAIAASRGGGRNRPSAAGVGMSDTAAKLSIGRSTVD
ncbi:hypothetical protein ACFQHO_04435 [Actinomadura yumaensis]|uniref:hypothetical protein n=1 Tax=Actinomadura yumaensis TaxID=111807 RepID=UPI003613C87E